VAPRLPLHSARRKPPSRRDVPQPDAHDAPGRSLARGGLELRRLGNPPRDLSDREPCGAAAGGRRRGALPFRCGSSAC
jgi:hypothetical protein